MITDAYKIVCYEYNYEWQKETSRVIDTFPVIEAAMEYLDYLEVELCYTTGAVRTNRSLDITNRYFSDRYVIEEL